MFGTPEPRKSDTQSYYYVPLQPPIALSIELECSAPSIVKPDFSTQPRFKELTARILSELVLNTQLFKNAPSIESLQLMTPIWGAIIQGSVVSWNTTTQIDTRSIKDVPCLVDLMLEGLHISRAAITPCFTAVFLKCQSAAVIDFDWTKPPVNDLEEVSDILSTESGVLTLKDPAMTEREKQAMKSRVREAFVAATETRQQAEALAAKFHAEYDISDDESAFTEWMSDESESDSS